jgi:hypothetical protein
MARTSLMATLSVVLALGTSVVLAQQSAPVDKAQGLAVGQNPKLLQDTRTSDAGAGNGGEFVRVCNIRGGRAHRMCSYQEIDPGSSGENNQSPECNEINCTFDPTTGR